MSLPEPLASLTPLDHSVAPDPSIPHHRARLRRVPQPDMSRLIPRKDEVHARRRMHNERVDAVRRYLNQTAEGEVRERVAQSSGGVLAGSFGGPDAARRSVERGEGAQEGVEGLLRARIGDGRRYHDGSSGVLDPVLLVDDRDPLRLFRLPSPLARACPKEDPERTSSFSLISSAVGFVPLTVDDRALFRVGSVGAASSSLILRFGAAFLGRGSTLSTGAGGKE